MILLHLQWSHFAAHPHNVSSKSTSTKTFTKKSETIIVFLYFPTFPWVPPSSELMRVWCSSLTFFKVISFWEILVESRLHLSCSSSSSCPVNLGTKGNTHTQYAWVHALLHACKWLLNRDGRHSFTCSAPQTTPGLVGILLPKYSDWCCLRFAPSAH